MCSTTWCETSSGVVGASGLDVAVVPAAAADLVDEAHFFGVGLDGREGWEGYEILGRGFWWIRVYDVGDGLVDRWCVVEEEEVMGMGLID